MKKITDLGVSQRMRSVQTPIVPEVAELIAQHPGTISLGQGVVHYPPPAEVYGAIAVLQQQGHLHKYQHVQGIAPLKDAIAEKLAADNNVSLNQRDVVVTAGSNMGFINAILSITDPGDEVILLSPYFFNHEMAVTMLGCKAVPVATGTDFQPDLQALQQAVTSRTKAIVTVSPNNPTGAVYSREALLEINDLCRDRQLFHISDEAYEYFVYEQDTHYSPCAFDNSGAHTIGLYSLSKAYGFASWRIGYMVVPDYLVDPIRKIQDTNLICPPVVSQQAALGALKAGRGYCQPHIEKLGIVRGQILRALNTLGDDLYVPRVTGAFYFLVRVNTALESMTLVRRLIADHGVAVIPGSTFGIEPERCMIRIAYGALDQHSVEEGIGRLVDGIARILASD